MMTHSGYLQFAEALVFAQGPKAEAEAAKARMLDWKRQLLEKKAAKSQAS